MATNMMKTMITVLTLDRAVSEEEQGFIMSHGDTIITSSRRIWTADQIKAAQDHLKGANTSNNQIQLMMMITMKTIMDTMSWKTMITVFDANRVISEDKQGFIMSHGDHNHYFFKKDLDSRATKGCSSDHPKNSHDAEPVKPLC